MISQKHFTDGPLFALSFLTRWPCSKSFSDVALARGLYWLWLPGLGIGLISTACAWLLAAFFMAAPQDTLTFSICLLAGTIWVVLEIWLSRGLHWDGAADLGDALGSGASAAKFQQILRDSHIGAFGVLTLLALFALQTLAAGIQILASLRHDTLSDLAALCLAPVWSRLTPVWLGYGQSAASNSSLGAFICKFTSWRIWLVNFLAGFFCLAALVLTGTSCLRIAFLGLAQIGMIIWFRRCAKMHGGLSGDFFGCCIECSQTVFLILSVPDFS